MNADTIIKRLGGPTAVAKLCEVSRQAVDQWRTDGIPRARILFLRLARPDVFAEDWVDPPASGASVHADSP